MIELSALHAAFVALIAGLLVGKAFYLGYHEGRLSALRDQLREADNRR